MKTVISLLILMVMIGYSIFYISVRETTLDEEFIKSSGDYIGQIMEVHESGLKYKTINGKISLGVNNITNKVLVYFTVKDRDVLECINNNIGKDSLVKLSYNNYLFLPNRYGSDIQVYDCKEIEDIKNVK